MQISPIFIRPISVLVALVVFMTMQVQSTTQAQNAQNNNDTTKPSIITKFDLDNQAKKAEVIVRATIDSTTVTKDNDVNYLTYSLTVVESIFGDANSLPQNEGKPAIFILQGLQDAPRLSKGQEAIFLLYKAKLDSPFVGFNQGFYPINGGKVSAGKISKPNDLRDAIRKAREGGQP